MEFTPTQTATYFIQVANAKVQLGLDAAGSSEEGTYTVYAEEVV